ncbi:MAG TPA: hypothetical protein VMS18_17540 [Candidatus Binatia bacterium]|nr:hypothetical protein [Candidatus Binatia bacterium]
MPAESHPFQLPNDDPAAGVAVRVTVLPTAKACVTQGPGLEQLKPDGLLETVPDPLPVNVNVNAGLPPPLPEPVKQVTFPVIYPVMIAPDDEIPPVLEFVVTVAETNVAPQAPPVTVRSPDESTVIIWGVLELHVTLPVMSFVTGGWM